jgi:PRTRC genetic system protein C
MQTQQLERRFLFAGIELPDPDKSLDVDSVRSLYCAAYPELATAAITGPEAIGDKLVYTFSKSIGTKG